MSDQHPVLNNLPINKWKVKDLKGELKRRNLKRSGLKAQLVERLNAAICKDKQSTSIDPELIVYDMSNATAAQISKNTLEPNMASLSEIWEDNENSETESDDFIARFRLNKDIQSDDVLDPICSAYELNDTSNDDNLISASELGESEKMQPPASRWPSEGLYADGIPDIELMDGKGLEKKNAEEQNFEDFLAKCDGTIDTVEKLNSESSSVDRSRGKTGKNVINGTTDITKTDLVHETRKGAQYEFLARKRESEAKIILMGEGSGDNEDSTIYDESGGRMLQHQGCQVNIRIPEPRIRSIITWDESQHAYKQKSSRRLSNNEESNEQRYVPQSSKPATNSLRIDRFVRPFTTKALQELLVKTGTLCNFWMDDIKTHCYVTYSSVKEATATRNAVYNLKWPERSEKRLVADFVHPQEVETRCASLSLAPIHPVPSLFRKPSIRERLFPCPPPISAEKDIHHEHGGKTDEEEATKNDAEMSVGPLSKLFMHTKVEPIIYYKPLSDEQVRAKLVKEGMREPDIYYLLLSDDQVHAKQAEGKKKRKRRRKVRGLRS